MSIYSILYSVKFVACDKFRHGVSTKQPLDDVGKFNLDFEHLFHPLPMSLDNNYYMGN